MEIKDKDMKVIVNSASVEFEGTTISELLLKLDMASGGFAIAIGDRVVPRATYQTYTLQESDEVTIIRATQGG